LWPLAIWIVATRRWRAAALAGVGTAAAFLLPFLALGLHVLRTYPSVLRALDHVFAPTSFSTRALFEALGASSGVARAGIVALGIVLALWILWLGRTPDGDRLAITAAIAAALLLSP